MIAAKRFLQINPWRALPFVVAATVSVPLGVILMSFLTPTADIWRHMAHNLLLELLANMAVLAGGVLVLTCFLGVSLAWLTGICKFPGSRILKWALLLPLAVPTYVLAFVFLGLFDFSGPVQTAWRSFMPGHPSLFPQIRSTGGVILVMSLALYPYVYLLSRNAFTTMGRRATEAAQALGVSRTRGFFKVALPMARPWIAGGLLLVLMETLADFGAVSIFNYNTFTTAIYKAWFGFFSLPAAAQLSSILVLIVFVVMHLEQKFRGKMQFTQSGRLSMEIQRIRLHGWQGWLACLFGWTVLAFGFVIPFIQLIWWSAAAFKEEFNTQYFRLLQHSLTLSLLTAAAVAAAALLLAYADRHHKDKMTRTAVHISVMGYAIPGTVLAVGLVIAIAWMDNQLGGLLQSLFGRQAGPILQGTLITMIVAYVIRFMATGFNALHSAMHRITPSLEEAAALMGVSGLKLLKRIHVPILRGGITTAALLVFVDVMKEMPITLMTRPFGWDTLAVKVFELTSEGEWERAALPALALILGGLLPVVILTKKTEHQK